MPPTTPFNCPYCHRRLQLPEEIRPGTKTRCPHADCRRVFAYSPTETGSAEEIPIGDGLRVDLMKELIADEERAATVVTNRELRGRNGGVPDEPVPAGSAAPGQPLPRSFRSGKARQPVPGHPLAPASERSKETLIGGKGVRFDEPRKYMGVLIGFLILASGYGCILAFNAFWTYYNNAADHRAKEIEKLAKDADLAKKRKFEDAKKKFESAARGGEATKKPNQAVPAPKPSAPAVPVNTANLDVSVVSARIGPFFEGSQQDFLRVTLRITNTSKVAARKAAWPGPQITATLRDSSFNHYKVVQPPAQDTTIAGGQWIEDMMVFDRTVRGAELTLDLTIPDGLGNKKQQIKILPKDVQ